VNKLLKLSSIEEHIKEIWYNDLQHELFMKGYDVLWREAGIVCLFFSHLKSRLEDDGDYGKKFLIIPEYSHKAPSNAQNCGCQLTCVGGETCFTDLCVVEFGTDLKTKGKEECNLWCFDPKPIIAMEFKYQRAFKKRGSGLLSYFINDVLRDVNKLNDIIDKSKGCQRAYLCLINEVKSQEKYDELLREVKGIVENNVDAKNQKLFRIALGSYTEESDFWKIEPVN